MSKYQEPQLMVELLPEFSAELERLLINAGEHGLANQVSELLDLDRCRCDDELCGAFYTQPRPTGRYGPTLRCLPSVPEGGHLVLDVVDDRIAHVEVPYRGESRRKLLTKFP